MHAERDIDLSATVVNGNIPHYAAVSQELKRGRQHSDTDGRDRKLRRLSEGIAGKDIACDHPGCTRMFKTVSWVCSLQVAHAKKYALASHVSATHMGTRHRCTVEDCKKGFAHKSTLRKHLEWHQKGSDTTHGTAGEELVITDVREEFTKRLTSLHPCPAGGIVTGTTCRQSFNRVYDLRRHLKGIHGIDLDATQVKILLASKRQLDVVEDSRGEES